MTITQIRATSFMLVLLICSGLQFMMPSRPFTRDRWKFTLSNLLVVAFNNILLSFVPLIPYSAALMVHEKFGLFNLIRLPFLVELMVCLLLLDLIIYFQHRLFHHVNILWRFHAMHHIDPMLDASSGLRFHPFEILISNLIKIFAIIIFGIAPLSVLVFEIVLNLLAMFNHSNIGLPESLEKKLSKVLITPSLHTIHHSIDPYESRSNYGFSVPWWDMVFKSFKESASLSQNQIHIGIKNMPDKTFQLFPKMLIYPFIKNS